MPKAWLDLLVDTERAYKENKLNFKFVFKAKKCIDLIWFINERCLEIGHRYEDGFAPVSGNSMKQITHDYAQHINWMRNRSILFRRGTYTNGVEAFKYRVNWSCLSKFNLTETGSINIEMVEVFINRELQKFYKLDLINLQGLEFMTTSFKNLRIDPYRAVAVANDQLKSDLKCPRTKLVKSQYRSVERKVDPWNSYFSSMNAIKRIYNKHYYLKVDHKAGRLHTNLTNLPGIYYQTLTVNRKQLVGYDIANSQPYFAACLINLKLTQDIIAWQKGEKNLPLLLNFNSEFSNMSIKPRQVYPSLSEDLVSIDNDFSLLSGNQQINDLLPLVNESLFIMIQDSCVNRYFTDVYMFLSLCANGDLYEKVSSLMLGMDYMDKQKVKLSFFQMFFSKSGNNHGIARDLKQMFPQTIEYIKLIKNEDRKTKGYFAILLQRLESEFILGKVCKRLHKEHPKAPIFTKHDSVYTTEEYRLKLLQIMQEESKLLFGVSPTFRPC
jgi:hypothetical protein